MTLADWIGSLGVTLLLLAFFLNAFGWLDRDARSYHVLNFTGAAVAGYASWVIGFVPFVVLECTWGLVALVALVRAQRRRRNSRRVT